MTFPLSRSGQPALEVASLAARKAGEAIMALFPGKREARLKGRSNLVTQADYASERVLLDLLGDEFPSCRFLSEESPATPADSPYTWVLDPLDGSNNFAFGIPFFGVSLALLHQDQVLLGITYDPVRGELFHAERGKGAWLGDKRLRVPGKRGLKETLVGFDLGYDMERATQMLEAARRLWPEVFSFRIMGSGALGLAYVAVGRLGLYLHRRLYPWDLLAGSLLVEEAGGKVSDWDGMPLTPQSQGVIAGAPDLHRMVREWLSGGGGP